MGVAPAIKAPLFSLFILFSCNLSLSPQAPPQLRLPCRLRSKVIWSWVTPGDDFTS